MEERPEPISNATDVRAFENPPAPQDIFCPRCGYNVRGLPANRCPECGRDFDPARLAASALPWPKRRTMGWFLAYWRTVWFVMFRNQRFCRETVHPLSYRDSQSFRWITILHAYAPVLIPTLVYYTTRSRGPLGGATLGHAAVDAWLTSGLNAGWLLMLAVATGVPSYLFHPRALPMERQNRAVTMSYYTCAPLAWTPVLFLLWALYSPGHSSGRGVADMVTRCILIMSPILLWWAYLVLLAKRVTARDGAALGFVAVAIPFLWLLAAGLTMLGVSALIRFLGLVFFSLRP